MTEAGRKHGEQREKEAVRKTEAGRKGNSSHSAIVDHWRSSTIVQNIEQIVRYCVAIEGPFSLAGME